MSSTTSAIPLATLQTQSSSIGTQTGTSSDCIPTANVLLSNVSNQVPSTQQTLATGTLAAASRTHASEFTDSANVVRHESWFRFRSKRDQWLAFLGLLLVTVGLVSTWYYSAKPNEVEHWEAEKDYWEYCYHLQERGYRLSNDCLEMLDLDVPPPPGHSVGFFSAALSRLQSRYQKLRTPGTIASDEDAYDLARVIVALWVWCALTFWYARAIVLGSMDLIREKKDAPHSARSKESILESTWTAWKVLEIVIGNALTPHLLMLPLILLTFSASLNQRSWPYTTELSLKYWPVAPIGAIIWGLHSARWPFKSSLHIWAVDGLLVDILFPMDYSTRSFLAQIGSLLATLWFSNNNAMRRVGVFVELSPERSLAKSAWSVGHSCTKIGGLFYFWDCVRGCALGCDNDQFVSVFGERFGTPTERALPMAVPINIFLLVLFGGVILYETLLAAIRLWLSHDTAMADDQRETTLA